MLRARHTGEMPLHIVRNTVAEPVFGNYLQYFLPEFEPVYFDVPDFLAERSIAPAVVLLYLPTLAPRLFDELYTLSDDERRAMTADVKSLLDRLFARLSDAVVFTFELDFSEESVIGEPSWNGIVRELNRHLYSLAAARQVRIADINRLIADSGCASMLSRRTEFSLGMRYTREAFGAFACEAAQLLLPNPAKKCLILDCDGVLWGGILSEDGAEHIELAQTGRGRAYRLFQRELLRLRAEGILLCLCSKNDEADVLRVMAEHPDMLLRPGHITAHRIGWGDKAASIRALADELNLSLDSFVFVDDSRFETEAVSAMLPDVSVVCLDGVMPYDFTDTLRRTGWFYKCALTDDDRMRAESYRQEKQRGDALAAAVSCGDFLASLETRVVIGTANDPMTLARAAELSQRTNQFNLSARRFTEDELQRIADRPDGRVYTLHASDRFGTLGTVAAAVVLDRGGMAVIEGFYLSCRAFARGFENRLLERIREDAELRGLCVIDVYRKTEKNHRFARFYPDAGIEVSLDE